MMVPMGKVKDHQISEKGIPSCAVWMVAAIARASQSIAKPQIGAP